jgi:hypothetical protein
MWRVTRATGSGAVALTLAPDIGWQLQEIRIHLNGAGGAGNLTITQDALAGAVYDTVLVTQDMTAVVNLVYFPARPNQFVAGDAIVIAWPNAGGKTYGIEVIWAASA